MATRASKTKSIAEAGESLRVTAAACHRFNMKAGTPFRLKGEPDPEWALYAVPLPDPGAVDAATYNALRLIDCDKIRKREQKIADIEYRSLLRERPVPDETVIDLAFGGNEAAFKRATMQLGLTTSRGDNQGRRLWLLSKVRAWVEAVLDTAKQLTPIKPAAVEKQMKVRGNPDTAITMPGVPFESIGFGG